MQEEMASTSACSMGERKECGNVGVKCVCPEAGAYVNATVRRGWCELSKSEEGLGNSGSAWTCGRAQDDMGG